MAVTQFSELTEAQRADRSDRYRNEWWSRDRASVDAVVAHSDEVVAFAEADSGALAAFAGGLTEYTYEVVAFDVVDAPAHRGTGPGDRLVTTILEAPALGTVGRYGREEVVAFDERHGFDRDVGGRRLLRVER